ncbi:hypothetical protein GCM10020001_021460 [Nonomuraea salmonea]
MAVAADAGRVIAQGDRFDPVDRAQVMQVFGAGAFQPALVGRQQGLSDAGHRLGVALEQGSHLFDDVGQRDPVGQSMRLDAGRAELRRARLVDLISYLSRRAPGGEAPGPDPPGDLRLSVLSAGHPGPSHASLDRSATGDSA